MLADQIQVIWFGATDICQHFIRISWLSRVFLHAMHSSVTYFLTFLVLQAAVPQIIANTEEIFFNKTIDNLRHTADICCTEIKDIPCIVCPYRPEGSMAMMVRN